MHSAPSYSKLALTWAVIHGLGGLKLLFVIFFNFFKNNSSSAPTVCSFSEHGAALFLCSCSLGIFRDAELGVARCLSLPGLPPPIIFPSLPWVLVCLYSPPPPVV